jgi:hypothetical protein
MRKSALCGQTKSIINLFQLVERLIVLKMSRDAHRLPTSAHFKVAARASPIMKYEKQ